MNAAVETLDMPVPDWPVIGFIAAVHMLALSAFLPMTFSWRAVGVALFLHWLTAGVGVTLGYHRLITHRSLQVPKWLEYVLLFCGTLACQSPLEWVAKHRMHHRYSDTTEDPHDINKGFWWAHVGWILHKLPCCPSSKHLGRLSLFRNEGSGSSRFDVKPLGVDGSSGVSGWSVS